MIHPAHLLLNASDFDRKIDGKAVQLYTLKNTNGIRISITNYGLRLISLLTPDKNGKFDDIVLGFSDLDAYINNEEHYFGAVIGRYSNRIAHGTFSLEGHSYTLAKNSNGHHLHGGVKGFSHVVWDAHVISDQAIAFTYISKHLEEGYPGTLTVKVQYLLTEDNALKIQYHATTDRKTVVSLTHHSYFNLNGAGNGAIEDHILRINADRYTPVNKDLIPTGLLMPVRDTPFDFTVPKAIGRDLHKSHPQLTHANGYDHNFVLNHRSADHTDLVLAACVTASRNGRHMELFTDAPGMQLYTGNSLHTGIIGKNNLPYDFRGAFCLEAQHFPNAPNQSHFPSTVLFPETPYTTTCIYRFSVRD